jgi:hypothetical protein
MDMHWTKAYSEPAPATAVPPATSPAHADHDRGADDGD